MNLKMKITKRITPGENELHGINSVRYTNRRNFKTMMNKT